jgi:hypothetical protein
MNRDDLIRLRHIAEALSDAIGFARLMQVSWWVPDSACGASGMTGWGA